MTKKALITLVLVLFLSSLFPLSLPALSDEVFTEELEWTVGDTWNYQITFQSGRTLRVSHEIIGEGTQIIDGFPYDVFIIDISGFITEMGDMPLNMKLVTGTSSITGVMYRAKDDTAQRVIMNMTAQVQGDPQDTVYYYTVSEERIEYITRGTQPEVIGVGTTWNITHREKMERVTILSGGQFGQGQPEIVSTSKTINRSIMCQIQELRKVPGGTFLTYKIRRSEIDNPGNYSIYYLSPRIKREVLLLEFVSTNHTEPQQRTELLPGSSVTEAPFSITALFTYTPQNPGINNTVTFNATPSHDPQGTIVNYSWSYTTLDIPHLPIAMGTGEILHYNWSHAQTYNITLKITNDKNETDTKTRSLSIRENSPPTAAFTYTPSAPLVNDLVTFDASASQDNDGNIVFYEWDWNNDGAFTSTGHIVYHHWETPGTYSVTLRVIDNTGGSTTITQGITIKEEQSSSTNQYPVADFSYTPLQPTDLDIISFTDTSTDPDGTIVHHSWNFGDGSTSSQSHPSHQYTSNGIYTIHFTVTDDQGATDTITQDLTILNAPPTATFTIHPPSPQKVNQIITFNSTATDPDGSIVNWTWNLGNNITFYGETITHTYTHDGIYPVTLTIKDDDGDTDTRTTDLTIKKENNGDGIPGFGLILLFTAIGLTIYLKKQHI